MADDCLRILFVDDDASAVQLARCELERDELKFAFQTVDSESGLRYALAGFLPDVVLCDYSIPGFSGLHALQIVRQLQPATPVLMISGSIAEDTAIDCLRHGATDYLLKSSLRRLGPAVRRAVSDARQRQVFEARIERLAHYDTLTGLPNLAHMDDLVCRSIRRARDNAQRMALVILDLDRFRFVDEDLGRSLANHVLQEIGAGLQEKSREHDSVARVGPDEFMIVLSDLRDAHEAGTLVQGLLESVAMPRRIAAHELQITASAGIALFPNDGADFESLLSRATEALHEAKTVTRGGLQFHSSELVRHAQQRRQLESGLRNAIQRNELSLYYQPQFEIRSGRVCGVEALARWFRSDGQPVAPAVFIPLAERSGMIGELGIWALRTGCKAAADWTGTATTPPTLCVNVSTQQICESFTAEIEHALAASGLPAGRLELEITESVFIGDADRTLDCLARWKALGVRIAVDDFGTGYSNFSYLSRLPIDRLKMDRSLIHGMALRSKEATIVRAVISLGRELGFTVLAEGVETEEQLGMLAELGCEQAQGYLLSRPTSAAEARVLMCQRWGARPTARGLARQRQTISACTL
jgi:diguanylate cyclase (GGDEF)-like protein